MTECKLGSDCLEHIRASREFYDRLDLLVLERLPEAFNDLSEIKRHSRHFEALSSLSEALANLTEQMGDKGKEDAREGRERFGFFKVDSKTVVIVILAFIFLIKEIGPSIADFRATPTEISFSTNTSRPDKLVTPTPKQ